MMLTDIPPSETGLIAGRYRVLDLVGRGAASKVYRGVDTPTGETVAIKMLAPEFVAEAPGMLPRFQTEGEILAGLRHPSIVGLVEILKDAGRHYLIMEFVAGGSLKDLLLRESGLPIKRAVEMGLDLADALVCAHDAGILHRDIKPSNILLAEDGTPRLSDFGVASLLESATGRLGESARQPGPGALGAKGEPRRLSDSPARPLGDGVAGGRVGTLAYMSPEAFRGEELGPESDIWSLGMVVYEMLAGRLPFEDESVEMFLAAAVDRPAPSVAEFRAEVPDELARLIRGMLDRDRSRRIASLREVSSSLEAVLTAVAARGASSGVQPTGAEYATPFIGREAELEELSALLRDPSRRLVSLIGPGGVGKSRLALESLSRLNGRFPDGVWFVPLAGVGSVSHIVPAIATAVGFSFAGLADPKDQLLNYLREKRLLLVLDNFEHLLDGVELLDEILAEAPRVGLLVTSRQRLNAKEENTIELAGLPFPSQDDEEPERYGAVRLFLICAERACSTFAPSDADAASAGRICRLVQGMPLGIELAGAWTRSLPCEKIASEIESSLDFLTVSRKDLPERHRSVRAVFDHSWHLLYESEKRVFRRLSVFRGGFTLPAARKVLGAPVAVLSALVDRSLLRRTAEGRYEVHELLRQYAGEKLHDWPREKEETRDLHCSYYADFLHEREDELKGSRQWEALEEIGREIDNVRQAWSRGVERGRVAELGKSVESLSDAYERWGLYQEGQEALGMAVAVLATVGEEDQPSAEESLVHGKILARRGMLTVWLGDYRDARKLLQRGLAMFRRADLARETAFCLGRLGQVAMETGEYAKARRFCQKGLTIARKVGDKWEMAFCLNMMGNAATDFAEARLLYEESLALAREIRSPHRTAVTLHNLGHTALLVGDYAGAERLNQEALAIARHLGERDSIAYGLTLSGRIALSLGEYGAARRFCQEGLAASREIGLQRVVAIALCAIGRAAWSLEEYAQARESYHECLEVSKKTGSRIYTAFSLCGLGEVAYAVGERAQAREFIGQSLAIFTQIGDRCGAAESLNSLGHLTCGLGEYRESREYFLRALKTATEISALPAAMDALVGLAAVLAKGEQKLRAWELLAAVLHHSAASQHSKKRAEALRSELQAHLFPQQAAEMEERGRARTLHEIVAELLQQEKA